jgi:hypothetical protein
MSNNKEEPSTENEVDNLDHKQDARNSRLQLKQPSLRKTNEEVLRKRLQKEAQQLCSTETKAFADCVQGNGFMVIFNCRQKNLESKYFTYLQTYNFKDVFICYSESMSR